MTVTQSLIGFALAAGLLTITPGLDTALVLRTAAVEGTKGAALAGLGILAGCLVWGAAVALGLGALLTASTPAFTVLKWAGALYLLWLGVNLLLRPRSAFQLSEAQPGQPRFAFTVGQAPTHRPPSAGNWLRRGLLTNLLNPKVGVFYVSFLPQFLPAQVSTGPYLFLLAALHAFMGAVWFAVLIGATRPIARLLQRPATVRRLDRLTGLVFVGFGLKLAADRTG
ncbi:MAG TPA: LysE family translocator [Steroidobacteraceae bacterium]|nr:LysE family translocator [Steroidobacteraceae bacterium]